MTIIMLGESCAPGGQVGRPGREVSMVTDSCRGGNGGGGKILMGSMNESMGI